jgi:deoxyribodipyrimidine photo-lyase
MEQSTIFWFRRDLRLEDNHGLFRALGQGNVIPIFIFDPDILSRLSPEDPRVSFIHQQLQSMNHNLQRFGGGVHLFYGKPNDVFKRLTHRYRIKAVFTNTDYEPNAQKRDHLVKTLLASQGIPFIECKDQVIFERSEIVKDDGNPYTVFTPFKKKWLSRFNPELIQAFASEKHLEKLAPIAPKWLSLKEIGFTPSSIPVKPINTEFLEHYDAIRDFPAKDQTSYASVHLRFGTVSVRKLVSLALRTNETYLSELIWREFFMQILYHFPKTVDRPFKTKYARLPWRNDPTDFKKWCHGKTGYPMVDAGMRQLNQTGYMHNRVRMVCASFLCKHLLIDWRWGEAYFAGKLLDFDISANVGNWQWAASTGCDAVPYFRIFNPESQLKKFDPQSQYIRRWVTDLNELSYPKPMIDHKKARQRCLDFFKTHLNN